MIKMTLFNNYAALEGDYDKKKLIDKLTFISEIEKKSYFMRLNKKISSLKRSCGLAEAKRIAMAFVKPNYNPRILSDGEKIPIGMLDFVVGLFIDQEFEIEDSRSTSNNLIKFSAADSIPEARDYQTESVKKALEETLGIIGIGTAGGKTRIALEIINALKKKFIFCTSRDTLTNQFAQNIFEYCTGAKLDLQQTTNTSKTYQRELNQIMQERFGIGIKQEGKNGIITTYHSLGKFNDVPDIDLLIADECHHVAAPVFLKNVAGCPARYRFGLSASINDRSDKLDPLIKAFLGPIIYHKTHKQLKDEKYVSTVTIEMWPFDHMLEGEDFNNPSDMEQYCIVENMRRNRLILSLLSLYSPNPILVFVKQIKHGQILCSMCERVGINAQFFYSGNQDENLLKWIRKPKGVVIATKILDTGVDSPTLQYALNAAGGRSSIAAEQQSGRIVRLAEGKSFAKFIDIRDKNHQALSSQTSERLRKYISLGYNVEHMDASTLPPVSVTNEFIAWENI